MKLEPFRKQKTCFFLFVFFNLISESHSHIWAISLQRTHEQAQWHTQQCKIRALSSCWQGNFLVWERSIWTILSQRLACWHLSEESPLCLSTEYRAELSSLSRITHQSDNWGQFTCPKGQQRKTRTNETCLYNEKMAKYSQKVSLNQTLEVSYSSYFPLNTCMWMHFQY